MYVIKYITIDKNILFNRKNLKYRSEEGGTLSYIKLISCSNLIQSLKP